MIFPKRSEFLRNTTGILKRKFTVLRFDLTAQYSAIAEHFNPPEIEEVRPSRPPRVSREIKFIIHLANGQDREVQVDEEVHVGTVLEIAKSNCNLRQDDPMKFTGWPTGGQPDNDLPLRYCNSKFKNFTSSKVY